MERIESVKNPLVKAMASLKQKEGREAEGLIFVEGEKMLTEALDANLTVRYIFSVEEGGSAAFERAVQGGARAYWVKEHILKAMADTVTPQGVAGAVVISPREGTIDQCFPLVALDGVQDPGNVGTIWRTADAAGYRGILLGEGCADAHSPKVIRSTMGSCFRVPVFSENLESALKTLKSAGYRIVAATLSGQGMYAFQCPERHALIVGSEARGVTGPVLDLADDFVRIPMRGGAESLNAAVSAGILMYQLMK